jgi:hypothetical protein
MQLVSRVLEVQPALQLLMQLRRKEMVEYMAVVVVV